MAQLIEAETDRHLWAETYDRELTDIFAIQSDVALQIAAALQAELSTRSGRRIRKEPTEDVEAYQLYLLGKHCLNRWTQEGVEQGIKYLEQAIARDPELCPGVCHHGLRLYRDRARSGRCAPARGGVLGGPRPRSRGRSRSTLGWPKRTPCWRYLKFACDYDWAGAEAEFRRALELNPNSGDTYDAYGLMLSALERYDEAARDAAARARARPTRPPA